MKRVLLFTSLMLLAPTYAFAQGTTSTSKTDQAGATALFYEARSLMQKGNYKEACPKLEESLRLDYGIGTEFNLADCNEHLGKTASAWSGFLNVASQAKTLNQTQREKVARERAKALEAKLPKMVIEVPAPPPGIEVKRDGVLVGSAAWGTAVPVDPGHHKIVVNAPGKQTWETTAQATEANTTHVTVPRDLPNAPVAATATPPKPASPPATVTPAPVIVAPPLERAGEPAPATTSDFPEPVVEKSNPQRTIGWVVGGVGLAGLGIGAGFGLSSLGKRDDAKDHCEGNVCDAAGVSLRDDAIRAGNVSTIATIAGGAALIGGIILIATAPSSESRETGRAGMSAKHSHKSSFTAVPNVARNGGGIMIQGVFQ